MRAEFHRPADKAMPDRFSRHYCDFHEMVHKGIGKSASEKLDLLARVAQHKNLFFRSSWPKYEEAVRGTIRIAPPQHRITALRDDYAKMQEMFLGNPPSFEQIISLLTQWEQEFNQK